MLTIILNGIIKSIDFNENITKKPSCFSYTDLKQTKKKHFQFLVSFITKLSIFALIFAFLKQFEKLVCDIKQIIQALFTHIFHLTWSLTNDFFFWCEPLQIGSHYFFCWYIYIFHCRHTSSTNIT